MTDALKIALVGIGEIAEAQHIPAISADPNWSLAATVSRDPTKIVPGVASFTDFSEMLEAQPDTRVVSLCLPPSPRYDYARQAIAAGRHVMLEKPPGATLSECFALADQARTAGVCLFASWHSRHSHGVAPAKAWLEGRHIRDVSIVWKEDVRHWHPGQNWIWTAGGMGVMDPGINALSILTEILPFPVHVTESQMEFPENCETPIAAKLAFRGPDDITVTADLDWRQTGAQTWDIVVTTDDGTLRLSDGGAKMFLDDVLRSEGPDREYPNLYRRMADLVRSGTSETDFSPMMHVADAFTLGQRIVTKPFNW